MEQIISSYIRKRRNKFSVCIDYLDSNGIKKQKTFATYEKKKDADKHLIDLKSSINNNKLSAPKEITFVERCYMYYKEKESDFSPKTITNANNMIKNYVEPYFKNMKLNDVNISIYQNFINTISKFDKKPNTIKKIYHVTNATLRECYRLREISENIPDFTKKPKKQKVKNNDIYSVDEIKLILDKCKDKHMLNIPINLFVFAGMRFGEIAGLCWEDIDFENNTLNINHNLIYDSGKFYMRSTKTDGGIRSVIVPDHVMSLLKEEKINQNLLKLQGLIKNEYNVVCLNTQYRYLSIAGFRQCYKIFLKNIGLRFIRPHNLRHAHVTMLMLGGVDMKTISERVGHTSIKITMDEYSHVIKDMDKKASDIIEKMLFYKCD